MVVSLFVRLCDKSICVCVCIILEVSKADRSHPPHRLSIPPFLQPILFKGTVAENIAYGLEGATRDQIIAAAKAAHAHDFIMQFSDGYETDLAEGSINVSGGQKQRLAIARAIIKNAPVLLLDEATSVRREGGRVGI